MDASFGIRVFMYFISYLRNNFNIQGQVMTLIIKWRKRKWGRLYHHWWSCMLKSAIKILLWNYFCFAHSCELHTSAGLQSIHPAKTRTLDSVFYDANSGGLYFLFFIFLSSTHVSLPSPACQHFSFLFFSSPLSFCYLSITFPLLPYLVRIKGHPWLRLGGH